VPETSVQKSRAIPWKEAREIVRTRTAERWKSPAREYIPIAESSGRVLASDVLADRDYPPLDRTARDGFAVRSSDMPGRVRVIGEVRAGDLFSRSVGPGEAVEIMTGAPVPDGADTIVMIEHVRRDGEYIEFHGEAPPGQFINFRGGEAPEGATVLSTGTKIGFPEVGMLAAVGSASVPVFARPHVAIVATGDELVEPGEYAEPYQIRNSNAYSLAAQVRNAGGIPEMLGVARDSERATREAIESGLDADLLLLSGGVSAGKYDYVEAVLKELGAEIWFDRVAIQPGQPLVFGRTRETPFFGLPGNPASTMVTFEIFARLALEMLAGQPPHELTVTHARLTTDFSHRGSLTRFLPARVSPAGELTPIGWTGSSDIAALTRANAFLIAAAEKPEWKEGEWMPVILR
jgi:molybdopterin molybdotransferase